MGSLQCCISGLKIKMIQLILQTQNSSSKNRLVVLTLNYMELFQVFTLAQEYKLGW